MRFELLNRIYHLICAPHIDQSAPPILRMSYAVTYAVGVLSVFAFCPLFYYLDDLFGLFATLIYGILAACTAVVLRSTGSLKLAWYWLSAFNFLILALLAHHQGGMNAPVAWWFPIVPIGQLAAGLHRAAVFWLLASVLYLGVLYGIQQAGYPMGIYGPDNPPPVFFVYFSIVTLMVIIMSYLLLLDSLRRQAFEQLRASNAELIVTRDSAIAAAEVKAQFLANMSHEIRTPMNGVLGTAQLLGETPLNSEQKKMIKTLSNSGTALLSLINDVLDFSKIEAGQLKLDELAFSPCELVEDVADLFASQAAEKGITLSCRTMSGTSAKVRGDPLRLRQVLTNLLSNAIKFTQEGDVEISVALSEVQDDSRVCLRFDVRDTGIGIGAEQRKNMFKVFSQGDASTTRLYGGTGLGLAISRDLVARMGGSIKFDSNPESGSRFSCDIPFLIEESDSSVDAKLPVDTHVVLIESHEASRIAIEEKLLQLGANVDTLVPPVSINALKLAVNRPHCTLLLDSAILTEGLENGLTGMDEILSLSVPVAVMVPIGTQNTWNAFGSGNVSVLQKPVRLSALFAALSVDIDAQTDVVKSPVAQIDVDVRGAGSTVRVLLAEDNAVNQQITVAILARIDCSVDVVADGNAAVRASQEHEYDLILMDCQMPVLDGFDATRAIRDRERQTPTKRVPIIALTASALTGDREACVAAGMDDYISKPFQIAQLQQTVLHWAESKGGSVNEGHTV